MGTVAKPKTASPPAFCEEQIGLIDLPMPEKTHNEWFRLPRLFGAVAGGSACCSLSRQLSLRMFTVVE
jgi:hypothetical protein